MICKNIPRQCKSSNFASQAFLCAPLLKVPGLELRFLITGGIRGRSRGRAEPGSAGQDRAPPCPRPGRSAHSDVTVQGTAGWAGCRRETFCHLLGFHCPVPSVRGEHWNRCCAGGPGPGTGQRGPVSPLPSCLHPSELPHAETGKQGAGWGGRGQRG